MPEKRTLEIGRLPPQAIDMEEAVLGALLTDRDAAVEVMSVLQPLSFYRDEHQDIYEAITQLIKRSEPVDILTVTERLRKNGNLDRAGGAWYIAELSNKVTSAAHVGVHARIVQEKFLQRELIRMSSEAAKEAWGGLEDPFDAICQYIADLNGLVSSAIQGGARSIGDIGHAVIQAQLQRDRGAPTGVPSGMPKVDAFTGGWQPTDLIILGARPGMGKTALALAWMRAAAEAGKPVLFFSMEMSAKQCFERLVGAAARIRNHAFRGQMTEDDEARLMSNESAALLELPIFIDDAPAQNIDAMRAKAKAEKAKNGIQLIVVDYLQLSKAGKSNKVEDVTEVAEGLKAMAKENDVPVIALAQLSRSVETRGGTKVPMLSDLRESGGIEQAADSVIFIYRPSYYGIDEDPSGNRVPASYAELNWAKHRNGALDTLAVSFYGEYMDWVDDSYRTPPPLDDPPPPSPTQAPIWDD